MPNKVLVFFECWFCDREEERKVSVEPRGLINDLDKTPVGWARTPLDNELVCPTCKVDKGLT